jgi:hypothetical protein
VALAEACINFAWHARGDGMSDTVTGSGWKLFAQRIETAKKILDDASSLASKCPHWYQAMQSVAKAQGWDVARSIELLREATTFAPDYYYYYRSFANYMLPKWEGQEGDAANFAEQSANRVGGTRATSSIFESDRESCVPVTNQNLPACPGRACKKDMRRSKRSTDRQFPI